MNVGQRQSQFIIVCHSIKLDVISYIFIYIFFCTSTYSEIANTISTIEMRNKNSTIRSLGSLCNGSANGYKKCFLLLRSLLLIWKEKRRRLVKKCSHKHRQFARLNLFECKMLLATLSNAQYICHPTAITKSFRL